MKQRIRMEIAGIVQGVGFRPYLHRLSDRFHIDGWVRNTSFGVELELEGEAENLSAMEKEIRTFPPPLACIEKISVTPLKESLGYSSFTIRQSASGEGYTFVSPDIAICPDCLRELTDSKDRRYRYPFLNCTNCGPRYTIIRALPYDRGKTTMASFPMCPECREEYESIKNRRYHAQPNCCQTCGPSAFYADSAGQLLPGDPFLSAQKLLSQGKILAVKGLGGFHLACNAQNEEAVLLLRNRKKRKEKALAIMAQSPDCIEPFCFLSDDEKALLSSPRGPIVLLEKRQASAFSYLSKTRYLGVMLPFTPLHHLLLDGAFGGPSIAVMTSANLPGCPVILDNEEALEKLSGIADGFLLHNRPIENRCDDSLVMVWEKKEYFFRRSRGYAPQPLSLPFSVDGILAMGAEQKASFAMGKGNYSFLSPHIGDLKNMEVKEHYVSAIKTYENLFCISPSAIACDLHPDYISTKEGNRLGKENQVPVFPIQHHWAHMASCMADNGLSGQVFGIIWDGTGLGTDGTVWGGEFLIGGYQSFRRKGSIRPILLPGGDAAVREPGRVALSLLWDGALPYEAAPLEASRRDFLLSMLEKKVSTILASSIGRLFDGIYSLLSGQERADYEGQGAVLLESMASPEIPGSVYPTAYEQTNGLSVFDTRPLLRGIYRDLGKNVPPQAIARGFMDALCRMALEQCKALNPEKLPVVLSGGVFFNRYLLSHMVRLLSGAGYQVYTHHRVSTGDEGICLGQMSIAAHQKE